MSDQRIPACRSVFKGGVNTPNKDDYNRLWAEIINRLEKRHDYPASRP